MNQLLHSKINKEKEKFMGFAQKSTQCGKLQCLQNAKKFSYYVF